MARRSRTILFVGGIFLPPFDIITFCANCHFDQQTAQKMFGEELAVRGRPKLSFEGMTMVNDVAVAAVYQNLSNGKKTLVVATCVPSSFDIYVDKLMGDSGPDETKMSELVNKEMLLQDVGGWTMGEALCLEEITIALVQC